MRSSALQVPIFFALNRFGFRFDGRHNLAGSVLINKSAGVQRPGWSADVHVDEILRNMQSSPQEVEGGRLRSLRMWLGMAGCLMATTAATSEFFCVSCRLTAGLDMHGRCATCGSDAVTHPLRYRLILSAADDCCIREKKAPLELSLKNSEESRPQPNLSA